ncbi:hypothetical protein Q5694_30790 [Streptomyces sp. AHA2]
MTRSPAAAFDRALAGYLGPRGWRPSRCTHCGRRYFAKKAAACGSPWCPGTASLPGTDAVRPPARPVPAQWQRMHAVFRGRGLTPFAIDPTGVARDTDLIVSALQYLDPVVHDGAPRPQGLQILSQPCVRWRYLPGAGRDEGVSSSFVNLSSLEADEGDLLHRVPAHLDLWLDGLSAIGLHAREITVALTDEECAYGPYRGCRADVNSAGIELGEINWYYEVDGPTAPDFSVIDCGFSFERMAWAAAARQEPYHDLLSPLYLVGVANGGVLNDRCRTLSLLALSGVRPGSRGPRRYVRRLTDELVAPFLRGVNIRGCLHHAARFWEQFLPAGSLTPTAVDAASAAVERRALDLLARALRQPAPPRQLEFSEAADVLAARSGGRGVLSRAVSSLAGVA